MPEFLGRPNLPNGLANSLVQLAAQEENPLATALKTIGGLVDQAGTQAMESRKEKEKFGQQKELKQMEIDARGAEHRAGLLTELVKNDQVVKSLIDAKPMNANDASALLGPGAKTTTNLIKADFGSVGTPKVPNPAAEGGIPSEDIGLKPGFSIKPKGAKPRTDGDRWVKVNAEISSRFPALKGIEGKDISTAQYVALQRSHEAADRYRGQMDDKLWARAKALAGEDMEYVKAAMDGDEAKVAEIIDRKKRLVLKTGGRLGAAPGASPRKELGSIIADAFEKGLSQ